MAEINRVPNPPGSPIEKLLTQNPLDKLDMHIRGMLSENPTRDEIVRALMYQDDALKHYIDRHNRELELWANTHRHPGGGSPGDPGDPIPGDVFLIVQDTNSLSVFEDETLEMLEEQSILSGALITPVTAGTILSADLNPQDLVVSSHSRTSEHLTSAGTPNSRATNTLALDHVVASDANLLLRHPRDAAHLGLVDVSGTISPDSGAQSGRCVFVDDFYPNPITDGYLPDTVYAFGISNAYSNVIRATDESAVLGLGVHTGSTGSYSSTSRSAVALAEFEGTKVGYWNQVSAWGDISSDAQTWWTALVEWIYALEEE